MERLRGFAMTGIMALLVSAGLAAGEPNEPSEERTRSYAPVELTKDGGWLPAPDESPAGQSPLEESLFAAYSFHDVGTVYNIEFYYRRLYSRLRVRVLVDNRELHGLFNRFYAFPSGGRCMLSVGTDRDGNPTVSTNFTQLVLKESAINTDAIYGALERFLSRSDVSRACPCNRVDPPPGLLGRTCRVRIMGDPVIDYLISEDGQVEPLTLESLRVAYNKEAIRAKNADDYKRIAWSVIVAEHESSSRNEIVPISSVNDIPDYTMHPLDRANESEIQAPQLRSDAGTGIDYWTCCTYAQFHGVVARCTFGFREGRLQSAERLVLADGIGNAYYLGGELRRASQNSGPASAIGGDARPRRLLSDTVGLVSAGAGALLLLCALLIRRHRHASVKSRGHESQ
ncbi:MAG: hypothetical protein JW955_11785 [Sedimentisphaerales bacterium]|nr:hypothetical protein [Sedimentisphaerales bacterium]